MGKTISIVGGIISSVVNFISNVVRNKSDVVIREASARQISSEMTAQNAAQKWARKAYPQATPRKGL